ncbi:hypothetical protein B0T11DRAFT_126570 [Plectosphaerella cucumerina]|uniref:Uncharacterized protein n=1 Tax=Plectosphaerella cucumerina TaxID=40658 RepID=A0A8K0TBB0_9PEZI|nr:hypothetical protein B0T11DRAFT_126570 [Plectosphaerella cucumerina]
MANANFSGVSNVLEVTPALVNFKFDFSLRKVEAPQEYHELGKLLNHERLKRAESGKLHITARRLGVLFEGVTPSTPALIKAYGLRASEIAKKANEDDKAQSFSHGIFSDHAGFDATSIWAGATSGSGALQVHLLACMLARIWPSPEATSIWAELLNVRQRKIVADFETTGSADLRLLSEAQQSLERHQLAEWDASARAWLRVADIAKGLQQKQLLLIIGDQNQPVNSRPVLYDGVMRAWVAGLTGMEALLSGTPTNTESGELLLALSSWHIYPDLLILDPCPTSVKQKDPLVPASGTLTIGLRRRIASSTDSGLHWSLPLAHLRYYGDPETKEGKITREGSRLTLPEFNMAVLGCLLGSWNIKHSDLVSTVEWVRKLSEKIKQYFSDHTRPVSDNNTGKGMPPPPPRVNHLDKTWLFYLGETARSFLESSGIERQVYMQLLKLGKNHPMFLGSSSTTFFGLSDLQTVSPLATIEQKVHLYRSQARAAQLSYADAIIHYVSTDTGHEEFASATEQRTKSNWSSSSGISGQCTEHCRWVRSKSLPSPLPLDDTILKPQETMTVSMADIFNQEVPWDEEPSTASSGSHSTGPRNLTSRTSSLGHTSIDTPGPVTASFDGKFGGSVENVQPTSTEENYVAQCLRYKALGEVVRPVESEPLKAVINPYGSSWIEWGLQLNDVAHRLTTDDDWITRELDKDEPWSDLEIRYELWLGSSDSTAIYIRTGVPRPPTTHPLSLAELHTVLDKGDCSAPSTMHALKKGISTTTSSYINSLRTLAAISDMYSRFRGATIDVNIFSSPFPSQWTGQDLGPGSEVPHRYDYKGTCMDREILASDASIQRNDLALFESSDLTTRQTDLFQPGPVRCRFFCDLCFPIFFKIRPMTSRMSFTCILWLESTLQLNPEVLDTAIALSSGNSLFIATAVTCDPIQSASESQVQHVMGNVGRPGISILVPPEMPNLKKDDLDQWRLINFTEWDGRLSNSFPESSLHVWFTGATQEIDIGIRGRQDKELVAVESVVSLHSRGERVTDLPIQAAKEALRGANPWIRGLTAPDDIKLLIDARPRCPRGHDSMEFSYQHFPLTAINNWDELLHSTLDAEQDCIFLARNNWQARLAALMISLARGKKVFLLPAHVCWECTREDYASDGEAAQTVLFIA